MSRVQTLGCGHASIAVRDYTDSYRWVVRCRDCGHEEEWTQREWRQGLLKPPKTLVEVEDEDEVCV